MAVYCVDPTHGDDANNGSTWTLAKETMPTLARGDLVWVAAGTMAGWTFDTAESGSSYCEVSKALDTNGAASIDGWSDEAGRGGQTVINSTVTIETGYYKIDGQTRDSSNWKDTTAYGFLIQLGASPSVGIDYDIQTNDPLNNVNLVYLGITHTEFSEVSHDGIYGSSVGTYLGNSSVEKCLIYGIQGQAIKIRGQDTKNYTITECFISNFGYEHGSAHGGILMFAGEGYHNDMVISYNYIGNGDGTTFIGFKYAEDLIVHGNVFFCDKGSYWGDKGPSSGGLVYCYTPDAGEPPTYMWNCWFANNTVFNIYVDDYNETLTKNTFFVPRQEVSGTPNYAYNNFWYNSTPRKKPYWRPEPTLYHDYNYYGGPLNGSGYDVNEYFANTEAHGEKMGHDTSIFQDYNNGAMFANLRLTRSTPNGLTLGQPYIRDMDDIKRGWRRGAWDRGAHEFKDTGGIPDNPVDPTIGYVGDKVDVIAFPGKGRNIPPGG